MTHTYSWRDSLFPRGNGGPFSSRLPTQTAGKWWTRSARVPSTLGGASDPQRCTLAGVYRNILCARGLTGHFYKRYPPHEVGVNKSVLHLRSLWEGAWPRSQGWSVVWPSPRALALNRTAALNKNCRSREKTRKY